MVSAVSRSIVIALSGILVGTTMLSPTAVHAQTATTHAVTVTPNPVVVGGTATVQGAGFTANSRVFVFWRRPDGTSRGLSIVAGPTGRFSFVLRFAPRHGIGTELVAAFDAVTRTWTPFSTIMVVARGPGSGVVVASPNPVVISGTTVIAGRGFTPSTIVVVQWSRPDGTMATARVVTNSAGAFAFRLVADLRHGCGMRVFTALDLTTLLAGAPLSLGEIC